MLGKQRLSDVAPEIGHEGTWQAGRSFPQGSSSSSKVGGGDYKMTLVSADKDEHEV